SSGTGCGRGTASTRTSAPGPGRTDGSAGAPTTVIRPTSGSGTPSDSTRCPSVEVPSLGTRLTRSRRAAGRNISSSSATRMVSSDSTPLSMSRAPGDPARIFPAARPAARPGGSVGGAADGQLLDLALEVGAGERAGHADPVGALVGL